MICVQHSLKVGYLEYRMVNTLAKLWGIWPALLHYNILVKYVAEHHTPHMAGVPAGRMSNPSPKCHITLDFFVRRSC